jgi:hypothetical protein
MIDIYTSMSSKKPVKENSFDGAGGGSAGAVNYATGWGTFASPANAQYPDRFDQQTRNTAANQTGGPAGGQSVAADAPPEDAVQKGVEQIFQKKDTPTSDEVASGLQYEMGRMITKDKARAKEIVITNMRSDPHYYSNLHMLNIDDKKMKVDELVRKANKTEITKIFQDLAEVHSKKYETIPAIGEVMRDLVRKKEERSLWKHGQTSQAPNG